MWVMVAAARCGSYMLPRTFVMAHVEVVPYHVGHGRSHEVWLVHVEVDADARALGCADGVHHAHAGLAAVKLFTPAKK